jgi:hypothetical protein
MSIIAFTALLAQARQSGFLKCQIAGCHVLVRYAELMAQGQCSAHRKLYVSSSRNAFEVWKNGANTWQTASWIEDPMRSATGRDFHVVSCLLVRRLLNGGIPTVAVAEWSKVWTVLARLDAGIVGSNPTWGMDVYMYVYVYSIFELSYVGRGLAMSWSLIQGVLGVLPCVSKIDL